MDGVTVLNNYEDMIYGTVILLLVLCIVCFVIAVISFINEYIWCSIFFITMMMALFLIGGVIGTDKNDQLQVMVDDSVSFNEFMEKYDVVDQDGLIWTVKPKSTEDEK